MSPLNPSAAATSDGRSSRTNLTLDTFVDSVASAEGPAAAAHSGSGGSGSRSCVRARAQDAFIPQRAERPADADGAEMAMGMGWRVKRRTPRPVSPCCAWRAQVMPFCQQGTYELYSEALGRDNGLGMLHSN